MLYPILTLHGFLIFVGFIVSIGIIKIIIRKLLLNHCMRRLPTILKEVSFNRIFENF